MVDLPPAWLRRGVVFVLAAVAAYQIAHWMLHSLSDFLAVVFLAWLFSITVEPAVEMMVRHGLRRGAATGLVMFGLTASAIAFVGVFGTLLVDQLTGLVTSLPTLISDVVDWVNGVLGTQFRAADINDSLRLTPDRIQQLAQDLTPGVFGILSSLVGLVFQALTLMLFAFYMSAEGPQLRNTVSSWFPPRQQRVISTVWEISVEKTGGYVVSRLILAVLSTIFTGIFLYLIGVPYWMPLAIWTGLVSQFIPTLGTYLAIAVPALIALAGQPIDAVWVVLFGTVYQQVENYLFAPRVTAATMQVHPAVAFGAVVVGAKLFGPVGALVSVPVVAATQAVIETYGHRYELVGEVPTTPPDPPPVKARRTWTGRSLWRGRGSGARPAGPPDAPGSPPHG
ncbi:AI-2E family transporter [Nocardioides mesophilus]|uniref:AI-2E family transporter n=1 Tax=Nocardioides mesophilus TaxID=433659 RepID=A0A7G9RGS5_9ACTN|nr:AI-2E family transporter [Nocardioides mesophilus]